MINIFYSHVTGHWPYYLNGEEVNGGIPQLGNLSLHLEKFRERVEIMIPDEKFNGLAIIDWERWSSF